MLDQMLLNMSTHFTFFRRNRLIMGIALLVAFFIALFTIPLMYSTSTAQNYDRLVTFYHELNFISFIISASLGIFLVSDHLRDRNIKMVLTKPCLPEVWLGSVMLSSASASFVMYLGVLLLAEAGNALLGNTFNPVFTFVSMYSFFSSFIVMSYLVLLGLLMRTPLAVLTVLLFSDKTLLGLYMLTHSDKSDVNIFLYVLNKVIYLLYFALPVLFPFSDGLDMFSLSRQPSGADWLHLIYTGGYAFTVAVFFFLLSDISLRRKKLI